jgi:hypothetical protein
VVAVIIAVPTCFLSPLIFNKRSYAMKIHGRCFIFIRDFFKDTRAGVVFAVGDEAATIHNLYYDVAFTTSTTLKISGGK